MKWTILQEVSVTLLIIVFLLLVILVFISMAIRAINGLRVPDTSYRDLLESVTIVNKSALKLNGEIVSAIRTISGDKVLIKSLYELNHHLTQMQKNDNSESLVDSINELNNTIRTYLP